MIAETTTFVKEGKNAKPPFICIVASSRDLNRIQFMQDSYVLIAGKSAEKDSIFGKYSGSDHPRYTSLSRMKSTLSSACEALTISDFSAMWDTMRKLLVTGNVATRLFSLLIPLVSTHSDKFDVDGQDEFWSLFPTHG